MEIHNIFLKKPWVKYDCIVLIYPPPAYAFCSPYYRFILDPCPSVDMVPPVGNLLVTAPVAITVNLLGSDLINGFTGSTFNDFNPQIICRNFMSTEEDILISFLRGSL